MNIILNGTPLTLEPSLSIEALLGAQGYDGKLVAVAVNGTFVPKSSYKDYAVSEHDKIEVVAPMQGG